MVVRAILSVILVLCVVRCVPDVRPFEPIKDSSGRYMQPAISPEGHPYYPEDVLERYMNTQDNINGNVQQERQRQVPDMHDIRRFHDPDVRPFEPIKDSSGRYMQPAISPEGHPYYPVDVLERYMNTQDNINGNVQPERQPQVPDMHDIRSAYDKRMQEMYEINSQHVKPDLDEKHEAQYKAMNNLAQYKAMDYEGKYKAMDNLAQYKAMDYEAKNKAVDTLAQYKAMDSEAHYRAMAKQGHGPPMGDLNWNANYGYNVFSGMPMVGIILVSLISVLFLGCCWKCCCKRCILRLARRRKRDTSAVKCISTIDKLRVRILGDSSGYNKKTDEYCP